MAANATNVFTMQGVIPAFGPWADAKRIQAVLPASVVYPRGSIMGEVTGSNSVQTLTITQSGTVSGTFTLSFAGATTANIAFNALASAVQTALEALPTIGVGNVAVTTGVALGTGGGILIMTFQNLLGNAALPAMTVAGGGLTNATAAISQTTAGSAGNRGNDAIIAVAISGSTISGTFTMTYGGVTSGNIPYNATAAQIQPFFDAMSSLGVGSTTILTLGTALGASGGTFLVQFTGVDALKAATSLTGTNTNLTNGTITITTVVTGTAPTSLGLWKAYQYNNTDGSQVAKGILEFDCATDSAGNITYGTASGGGDKQQTYLSCPIFVSGTFRTEDLYHGAAPGVLDANAVSQLGRLIEGNTNTGTLRIG